MIKKNIPFLKSIGFKIILFYLFIQYIPQTITHYFLPTAYDQLFKIPEKNPIFIILLIMLFLTLLYITSKCMPKIKTKISLKTYKIDIILLNILIIIFFILSLNFYLKYDISFRHSQTLENAGILVQGLWALFPIFKFYLFLSVVKILNGQELTLSNKYYLLMIFLSFLLSINSSSMIIYLSILLLLLCLPKKKYKSIFFNKTTSLSKTAFINTTFSLIFLIIIIGAIFLGTANKIGVENTIILLSNFDLITTTITNLILRLSTNYVSALNVLENITNIDLQIQSIYGIGIKFIERLNVLIPLEISIPKTKTINGINVSMIFHNFRDDGGASTGLLGHLSFIPLFPFNIIFLTLYTLLIIRTLNKYIICHHKQLSLISMLILYSFITPLLHNPSDIFLIDGPAIYFILFILYSFKTRVPYTK